MAGASKATAVIGCLIKVGGGGGEVKVGADEDTPAGEGNPDFVDL